MIRKWLQVWLQLDKVDRCLAGFKEAIELQDQLIEAQAKIMQALDGRIDTIKEDVAALKYQREQRERKRFTLHDWEQLQAEFAANPENFKETN